MVPELSPLGIAHTAISLAAIGCGLAGLMRSGRLEWASIFGRAYAALTALTALTALGIHQRGGFGPGHALAVLTLLALGVAWVTARGRTLATARVHAVALSATGLCHAIPGMTEGLTRLPPGAPLVATPESPLIQGLAAAMLLGFVVLAFFQARRIQRAD